MPLSWLTTPIVPPCPTHRAQAEQRQQQLTKPQGSLGRLETLAIELAAFNTHKHHASICPILLFLPPITASRPRAFRLFHKLSPRK